MTFSIGLFQVSLIVIMVLAGLAALFLGGRGLRGIRIGQAKTSFWKDDAAHRQGLILFGPQGDIRANRGARILLGGFSGKRPTRRSISERIAKAEHGAAGVEAFETSLAALLTSGTAFEQMIRTKAGKHLNVIGEPRGASAALSFHNISDLRNDVVSAKSRAATLKEQSDMLSNVLTTANVIAGRLDSDGVLVWRSEAFAKMPDRTRKALTRSAKMLGAGVDAPPNASDVVVGDVSYILDVTPAAKSGLIFYASLAEETTGGDEAFRRFVNTMAETFAHLKVSLMIFDQERRLTLFNPATVNVFGGDVAWLGRRPTIVEILDNMRATRTIPEQTDFIAWRDALLAQFEGEEASEYVADWALSDGRTIHVNARPHPSGGLAVTAEDITESVDLLRTTAEDRAVMLATTDFIEEALIVFGPDGKSRLVNAAFLRLWNFPADAFVEPLHVTEVAKHCSELGGGEQYWPLVLDRVTAGGGRRKAQEKFRLSNGAVVLGRYSPMPDGSSLLVTPDISASENTATALRQRNEALEHTDEIRGALVDQISHQLRTPLNAVSGFGQLLADERFGALTERQRTYVEGINQSSSELLDAINGMTDLITVGSDSMSLDGELLDPTEMLNEVLELVTRRFGAESAAIKRTTREVDVSFRAHRVRLRQIIFNILVDVLTKSRDQPDIQVDLRMKARILVITVEHAAEPGATNRGLALSLVKRFTSLHDGSIEVIKTSEGRRCVTCTLPESAQRSEIGLREELPLAVEV